MRIFLCAKLVSTYLQQQKTHTQFSALDGALVYTATQAPQSVVLHTAAQRLTQAPQRSSAAKK